MSFPYLLENLGELRIEHLQLDEMATEALRQRGAVTISGLVKEIGRERFPTQEVHDALAAVHSLASVCGPRDVDWLTYWCVQGYNFRHRFLTCPELEEMDVANPVCGISKVNFGNAGAMLHRAGISTLGDLAARLREGLTEVPGMGEKKWAELFETLIKLVRDLRDGRISSDSLAAQYPVSNTAQAPEPSGYPTFDLRQSAMNLHIGVLHLGTKTSTLEAQGIRTVGDAANALPSLLSVSGIGRTTVSALEARLALLADLQNADDEVDWERYCGSIGVPLLPRNGDPAHAAAFVGGLGGLIAEMGDNLEGTVVKLVIERRLSRLPHQRATLEEIGSWNGVNMTRERVRQIESRLLKSMVAALLDDDYSNLDVHFRPGFARFWKAAADRFSNLEEVSHATLVNGLAEVWGVDAPLLTQQLPFIVTIITGDVPTGRSLGDGARLAADLIDPSTATANLPLRRLQIGRHLQTLEAHGLDTLGKFVDAIRLGAVSRRSGSHFRSAIDHLNHLAGILDEETGLDWTEYLARLGTTIVPAVPTATPSEFLRTLVPTLTELLELGLPTNRAPVIFARRTSHAVDKRISTEALAKELGSHGSSIKREETELLLFLNEVLVGGNLAIAGAHVRDDFLERWKDAAECFVAADGVVDSFKMHLEAKWGLGATTTESVLPTIVAVLTGYPYKRLGRHTKMAAVTPKGIPTFSTVEHENQDVPLRIVLRGFKRQH